MRRILLVEPVFHIHSLDHFRAALRSDGFEDAQFVLATGAIEERDRERILRFIRENPRAELRELHLPPGDRVGRWKCWQRWGEAVRETEEILRRETFSYFAYLMFDHALHCFALPGASARLRAHFDVGVRGMLLRDNGLRPAKDPTPKERFRDWGDRLILRRALRSGAIRKLAFCDHRCADVARALYGDVCGYGIDAIDVEPREPPAARARLGWPSDAWVALIFGLLSDRKGVVETLQILAAAEVDLSRLVLVLAGPVEPDYRPALQAALEAAEKRFRIIWRDQFVPDSEMPDYFAAADCVVCAYKRFNASSGVLLQAASHGKPVIVSRDGVMHDAIERYPFGEAVDLADPPSLVSAVQRLMNAGPAERATQAAAAKEYAATRDARCFMAQFQ